MRKINQKLIFIVALFVMITSTLAFTISEKMINSNDGLTPSYYLSKTSFVEDTTIFTEDKDEWPVINKYFSAYAKTENSSNFHSLDTARFDDINGVTVTVDTFHRKYKGTLNDPNYAMGMLLYQAILYKVKHPEKEMNVRFAAFRFSVSAAICINPNSPYYGYMRSIYDADYDDNGFVRIAYLFVEAARMGINVNIISNLTANPAQQYNNSTGKTTWKSEPSPVTYYKTASNYSCYSNYATGKKVKDFLTFKFVEWTHDDKTFTDVMHIKTLAVSNYLDKYGIEHGPSTWFSSENLDAYDYRGYNGNARSQNGVIVSDHARIYEVACNYMDLVNAYTGKEDINELRTIIRERNVEQISLILEGKESMIPADEQIVYLGSENDDVFELYFTPYGGDIDSWDLINNPHCKYFQEFYDSTKYVELCFNNPNFLEDFFVSKTLLSGIEEKFIDKGMPGNRLSLNGENATFANLMSLEKNENLDFVHVNNAWDAVHEKDLLMSYDKDGVRQYITLHTSCNFNIGALYYQINFSLVIKENENIGNVVYKSLGQACSKGSIIDDGQTFSSDERWQMQEKLTSLPRTVEADFVIQPSDEAVDSYGVIFSNNDFYNNSISFVINKNGNPEVILGIHIEEPSDSDEYKLYRYTFNNVNVVDGTRKHVAFTVDDTNKAIKCYVNGALKQTISSVSYLDNDFVSSNVFVVGGDHLESNPEYFTGLMYDLYIWSDVRTATEISTDYKSAITLTDTNLLAGYEFVTRTENSYPDDLSSNDNDCDVIRL